jgi:hypothetical protein
MHAYRRAQTLTADMEVAVPQLHMISSLLSSDWQIATGPADRCPAGCMLDAAAKKWSACCQKTAAAGHRNNRHLRVISES